MTRLVPQWICPLRSFVEFFPLFNVTQKFVIIILGGFFFMCLTVSQLVASPRDLI